MPRIPFKHENEFMYESPQDMYRDYKQKSIKGLLDYQSEILSKYTIKALEDETDFSLELPTGSGKTLVGLLICEYRRRKYKERTVFVCLNNQLVDQVIDEARTKYQISVVGFTGKFSEYSAKDLASFEDASATAVVSYSAIFNRYSRFSQIGTIVFDDAHNASNFIDSNWTVRFSRRGNSKAGFDALITELKGVLNESSLAHLERQVTPDPNWCDMLAWPALDKVMVPLRKRLSDIISPLKDENPGIYYSWQNIQDHLSACQLFLSEEEIVIKPQISPTHEIECFKTASQRIYMSATTGRSGELQRTFGIPSVINLAIDEKHVPSIGRRFFIFPDIKFSEENQSEHLLIKLKETFPRALILVPSNKSANSITDVVQSKLQGVSIYDAEALQNGMEQFVQNTNGVAILANRYDGISFPGDACHLLLVKDLPRYQNLQDRFFTSRLKASPLSSETLKNRITQAVGRCTRNTTDYAVVIVEGRELQSILGSPESQKLFSAELRSEIKTGYIVSKDMSSSFNELKSYAESILNPGSDEWQSIDEEILLQRDNFQNEDSGLPQSYEELQKITKDEVAAYTSIWNGDNHNAIQYIQNVIDGLNDSSLEGLKQYWQYLQGALYYRIKNDDKAKRTAVNIFKSLRKNSSTLTWFQYLDEFAYSEEAPVNLLEQERVSAMVDNIERNIERNTLGMDFHQRMLTFSSERAKLLEDLKKLDHGEFETPLEELGNFIGFRAFNSGENGAPDPWWLIDNLTFVVTELKQFETSKKPISLKNVRESAAHPGWIKNKYQLLYEEAKIYNVLISNSNHLSKDAYVDAEGIYYVNRADLVKQAKDWTEIIKELYESYQEPGDMQWREFSVNKISSTSLSPRMIINFFTSTELKNL